MSPSNFAGTIGLVRRAATTSFSDAATRRRLRLLLMVVLPALTLLAGAWTYLAAERYASTDDAYIGAATVTVSSDVPGRVAAIDVHDNQSVKRGQVLFQLDDRPYRIAVAQAAAQLANAQQQVAALRAAYRQRIAELGAAQAALAYADSEYARQGQLLAAHVGTRAAFDQAQRNEATARQQVAAAEQQIASVAASLDGNPDLAADQQPLVQQAEAQLSRAQLSLGYTTIRAPADGIVTNVSALPVGDYLNAAAPAFSLVETGHLWIDANYKETELAHLHVGDKARVTVDAYPGETFRARVTSLKPGTGTVFSVLPPQNASGNWVKVVQRLPVRLNIENPDPRHPLAAGMSATVDVNTGYVNPILAAVQSAFGIDRAVAHPAS
jgi:membrane fusion protein, multidrug efflux system